MKCDQDLWYDLKKLLWHYELNPRVRCAFGNVYLKVFFSPTNWQSSEINWLNFVHWIQCFGFLIHLSLNRAEYYQLQIVSERFNVLLSLNQLTNFWALHPITFVIHRTQKWNSDDSSELCFVYKQGAFINCSSPFSVVAEHHFLFQR